MTNDSSAIIILTPGFAADEADINCLPFHQSFVKCFKKKFPQVEIFILALHYPYFRATYDWYGIRITSFNGKNKGGFSKILLLRRVQKVIDETIKTKKVKGLLSFWCGDAAMIAKKAAGKYGLKYYSWIMGQDASKENSYVGRINPKPGELIAISDFVQSAFLQNHGLIPAQVITPGIDPASFPKDSLKKDIDILGAGSLVSLKRYGLFVDAVNELKKTNPGIRAVLCGKGPLEKMLRNQVSESGLDENIIITGEVPHHEILRLMQRSRVFLHPSSYEGFSVACLEALYAGASVVSFHQPMKEKIENWHVISSTEEMITKLAELLQTPADNNHVLFCPMEETIQKIYRLFYKEDITS